MQPLSRTEPEPLRPPEWVWDLVDRRAADEVLAGIPVQRHGNQDAQLLSTRVRGARQLDAEAFAAATTAAYDAIGRVLGGGLQPLRLWNFVPGILEPLGGLEHRYMVFNRGRHRACADWCGGERNFGRRLATASAVGHEGDDLWVHALAGRQPGEPIENPRQVSAYRYSARYGPLPPCFSRATLLPPDDTGARRLLIGGTASVRGEDSVHPSRLSEQIEETLENLRAVVREGATLAARPAPDGLEPLRQVRIYFVRAADRQALAAAGRRAFPGARQCELVAAQLCRPELLVEIEALAELS